MTLRSDPIKLAFNGVALLSPLTGIGQYTLRLAQALAMRTDIQPQYFYGAGWSPFVKDSVPEHAKRLMTWVRQHVPYSYELRQYIQTRRFVQGTAAGAFDVYHEPNNVLLPFDGASVLTVHDLSWIRYSEMHPIERVRAMDKYFEPGLRRATRIITDSAFVKRELMEVFGVSSDIIHPVLLGAEPSFQPMDAVSTFQVLEAQGLKHGSYWLAVGTLEPRKNLQLALKAFMRLPPHARKACPMVLVGMKGWNTDPLLALLKPLIEAGEVKQLGYLSRQDLAAVVAGAKALVYPSVYEGFGLPPLEAMCAGIPVIACNVASLPEVVGEAGILVDPNDVDGLTTQLERLLDDASLRNQLAQMALLRSKQFSWEQCADETVGVYKAAMS